MRRFFPAVVALLACGCGNSTAPTPPPTEDPPQITCPVVAPIQLTAGTSSGPVTFAATTIKGKAPVTTTCVLPSGSSFPVGTTVVTCTATDALQRPATCSFPIVVMAPPVTPILSVTSFLAFGDSITRGEDGVNGPPLPGCEISTSAAARLRLGPRIILPDAQTYPGVLAQTLVARYKLQSPTVDNQGCPGEPLIDPVLGDEARLRFDQLIASRRYEVALVMEGTNDIFDAHNAADVTTQQTILQNAAVQLRHIVEDAQQAGLRPLLATIPPIDPTGSRGQEWGADLVPGFNDRVRLVASATAVPLVDVYQAFNGNLSLLGADGVHPTPAGYIVVAGAFADAIKNSLELKAPTPTQTISSFRRR